MPPDSVDSGGSGPDGSPAADVQPQGCSEKLAGTSPFGRILRGTASLQTNSPQQPGGDVTRAISLDVFFPGGRTAGSSVVISTRVSHPNPGVRRVVATLDGYLGAPIEFWAQPAMESFSIRGTLDGPDGGMHGELSTNIAPPGSDIVESASGQIQLCPSGDVPAPTLAAASAFAPTSTIIFAPNVPVDASTASVVVTADGEPIDVDLSVTDVDGSERVWVWPRDRAFPPGKTLALQWLGTSDILGREFSAPTAATPLSATAVITDLTFAESPPDGAVAASAQVWATDGELTLGGYTSPDTFDAVLGLVAPQDSTSIRVRGRVDPGCITVGFYAVAADGEFTEIVRTAMQQSGTGPQSVDAAASLLSTGPVWLVVSATGWPHVPQSMPGPGCTVGLDEIVFE